MADAHSTNDAEQKVAVVKKYANRRLYNTGSSRYVTLDDLSRMVRQGQHFVVHDAKTGEDLTRSILTQIILEEDGKGRNLLPISFLRQLISFYGDNLQALVPRYLEQSMAGFARNQEQMRKYLETTFGGLFPFGQLEEMGKQNMAILENTMKMFTPFNIDAGQAAASPAEDAKKAAAEPAKPGNLEDLKSQLEALQKRLEELSKKGTP